MRLSRLCALLLLSSLWGGCVFSEAEVTGSSPDDALDQGMEDQGAQDMGQLPDDGLDQTVGPDAGCVSVDAATACNQLMAECGSVVALDSCGNATTLQCTSSCDTDQQCIDNKCVAGCAVPPPEQFCNAGIRQLECGAHPFTGCGQTTLIDCGICPKAGDVCAPDGTCSCEPESSEDLCAINALQCGPKRVTDRCGMERDIECGQCADGECRTDNTCPTCQSESDDAFCVRLGAQCGPISGTDNCGKLRQDIDCGGCDDDKLPLCQANKCVCDAETDAELCAAQNAQCGTIVAQDRCGAQRQVTCGAPNQVCPMMPQTNVACTASNQCCYPEQEERQQRQQLIQQGVCGAQQVSVCEQNRNILVACPSNKCCASNGRCVELATVDAADCIAGPRDMGVDMASDMGSNTPDADM